MSELKAKDTHVFVVVTVCTVCGPLKPLSLRASLASPTFAPCGIDCTGADEMKRKRRKRAVLWSGRSI